MAESASSILLGEWSTDPEDVEAIENYGRVTMNFRPNGTLVYTIHGDSGKEVMLLTYRVEKDVLITNQPSSPREDRTKFFFDAEGRLRLLYDDRESRYVRP